MQNIYDNLSFFHKVIFSLKEVSFSIG